MLKTGIVWQEETFKNEENTGEVGVVKAVFSFLAFLFFGWAKTLSYKFFRKSESKES